MILEQKLCCCGAVLNDDLPNKNLGRRLSQVLEHLSWT
jgi:hypothetical protein